MKTTDENQEGGFGWKPEALRPAVPMAALMNWLEGTRHRDMIFEPCAKDFATLCKMLDHSDTIPASHIGLEIHHHPKQFTDISIFGGKELLRLPGVIYPIFASNWRKYLEDSCSIERFPPELIVEFDHKANGYQMMGFFQRCSKQEGAIEAVMNAVKIYSETSRNKQESSQPKSFHNQAQGLLRLTMEQLGKPDYIGFVGRGEQAVKLIITINHKDLPNAITFLKHNYSDTLSRGLGDPGRLDPFLRALLGSHELVRTSIDFRLTANQLDGRLAFECFPGRSNKLDPTQATTDQAEEDSSDWNSHLLEERFSGYKESMALVRRLPYGQKRPAANLIDEELMTLNHTHRKFILAGDSLTVKDYVLLSSSRLSMSKESGAVAGS